MINIRLLGHPQILHDGEEIELKRRKALALLAFLAITRKTHSRDSLTALFFSDQEEKQARSGLRLLLTDLNKSALTDWLVIDRNTIALKEGDGLFIDVVHVLDLLNNAPTPSAMQEAIALYADHFMKGFTISGGTEFDHWQSTQTQVLQKKIIGALEQLVRYQVSTNNVNAVISTVERWLSIDPYYEMAQRQLMRAYVNAGQRAAALHQYTILEALLAQELNEEPQARTVELVEAIRNGDNIPLTEYALPVFGNLPPVPELVVGRENAIVEMRQRLAGTGDKDAPTSNTHIVQGWPGIGKTTLSALIAHDPHVHTLFPDGVLWTSLGETPDVFAELSVWANALDVDIHGVQGEDDLSSRIMTALKPKRMLIVVDDAWDAVHVTPFKVGGNKGAMIITTRINLVARELAARPEMIYKLPILSDEQSLELMRTLAPEVVASNPDDVVQLAHDLEGLPLALQVAGRLLRAEMSMGWGVKELLDELRNDTSLLAANAPADRMDTSDEVPLTVNALLRKSTDLLDDENRERFALLGVFAPKPAFFDLDAMQAVWATDTPRETVRTLVERGLLEPANEGQFQIHALLVMHAKSMFA